MIQPDDLAREVGLTRARMTMTLKTIEAGGSPPPTREKAMETFRGNDQWRMTEVVRDNSVPLALMGLGLGWLLISSMRGGEEEGSRAYASESYGATEGLGYGAPGATGYGGYGGSSGYASGAGYSGEYGRGEGTTGGQGTMAGAKRRAEDVAERASRMAGEARERVGQVASQAREQMSGVTERVRHQASDIADRSWHMFQDHPLMMGSMALLVGAAIGASLPRSRAENRAFGDARQDLMRSASEGTRETMEKAKRVASRAAEATREEGTQALERVREATREEAERQNLTGGGEAPGGLPH